MGLFNAISSIGKINNLLKDLENQIIITQRQVANNAPTSNLQNSFNVLKKIHQELIDLFGNSNGASCAVYSFFGKR